MTLREALNERILLLDGGMGSMVQRYNLMEADFRGERFAHHAIPLKGNNDVLVLTRPDVIRDIHRQYLEAGADIITTDTFSSQRVSQQEYGLTEDIAELNRAAARIARSIADEFTAKNPAKPRFVLGDVGPTSKMLSMSESADDPAARAITFDEMESAYMEQIRVLVEEGVDAILIETIFDTLNAKAAASAYLRLKDATLQDFHRDVTNVGTRAGFPELMFSMTVSDASGRTLSGQTVEAFVTSVMHAEPLSVGLNCGLGADGLLPWLQRMSACAPCFVSCHPNAGLPNQEGLYDQTPEQFASLVQTFFDERLVNIVGGCCGTTPEHIAALQSRLSFAEEGNPAAKNIRQVPEIGKGLRLSGLEMLEAPKFLTVGERCNVAGSRKFLKLINEKHYDEALEIARKQVEDGAMVIDVNMDDGLLDAKSEMRTFLNLIASDPDICRVPVMVDSSRFDVIEEGLKCLQGKGIVNSISLKMGEEEFLDHARTVKRLGAAVIDMCFDEEGQATDYERRIRICERGYRLLTHEVGFAPEDIIFDPNVLTIATGMEEHAAYAADFIRATRWVTDNLPGARISGGLSNLSFAFRGNNYLREAMHCVFLHHAIPNGMSMAIMNPATALEYKKIPMELRLAIGEVVLNTSPEAAEELIEIAQRMGAEQAAAKERGEKFDPVAFFGHTVPVESAAAETPSKAIQEKLSPEEVLRNCLLKGVTTGLKENLLALLERGEKPVQIISGPLMEGMNEVGRLFGEGKMFLPQVVKTARTMKAAVEVLNPYFNQGEEASGSNIHKAGTIVIATVKGDVHDIGKNIVGVVLTCNNFRVVDLGVMVPPEQIVEAAIREQADFVCLSGLITPSLEEMCEVARQMERAGLTIPILVGGATTSPRHTAIKLAPCYSGPVFHLKDAAQNPVLCMKLLDDHQREQLIAENRQEQECLCQGVSKPNPTIEPQPHTLVEERREASFPSDNMQTENLPLSELVPLIDWKYFHWAWRTEAATDAGKELRQDADKLLRDLLAEGEKFAPRALQSIYPAVGHPEKNQIEVRLRHNDHDPACPCCNRSVTLSVPRQTLQSPGIAQAVERGEEYRLKSLSDFVPKDGSGKVGVFAVTMSEAFVKRLENLKNQLGGGDFDVMLLQTLGDRLAEAGAEYLSQRLTKGGDWKGIRPAVGYPSWPDQRQIFQLAKLLDFESLGIRLTENGAMYPQASTCGIYLNDPQADYFAI